MIHHVEINVSDLQTSRAFWDWIFQELGYSVYQDWDQGVSWRSGTTYLVFVQTEPNYLDIPYHRKRAGLNHLAFQANSKEQVDRMTKHLEERGVPILYKDRHPYAGGPGHYAVFFEDPDRIKVEIVAP
ncbi:MULTISPECIES: VOC family protein [Paenibacillus]|jgi:catechol 2,3-dioxygenase-like lactoylglutathione lyase family enzyme|uniref:Catechol 2,3-dioxygenase n=1 Tax=Paenibacillus barengoltzii J12 TaxID=935846 RepID=A0ABY1M327_9BACL|nr:MULTISPECIES: VOC family protein [Paenibacillus]MDU0330802.1 VOC family protein [Paenibacillus sp. 3LSP]MEC2343726.1 VOC family protein [Paenibacillus barengoltzii]SMF64792.1 Catechol 2,3-dioxygenase [Paenibacillus barengoltzii J12]SMF65334.1 Catechol 2,3-dioxygenase [Paenibacillus barengoltzii]